MAKGKTPPILAWLRGLGEEEREKVKQVLAGLDQGDGVAFLSQLTGRPVTEAEYLLVLGELGLTRRAGRDGGGDGGSGRIDWEEELKWLYSQVKKRIVLGRSVEDREGVPLPSVDKMVEVASKLVEIAFKYKSGEKDLYAFLSEITGEGDESESGGEGGEES